MIEQRLRDKYLDQIVFLDLQAEKRKEYSSLFSNAPIPLFQDDMVEMMREQRMDSVPFQKIIPPLVTILALDESFPYYGAYQEFLDQHIELFSYLEESRRKSFEEKNLEFYFIYGKILYEFRGRLTDKIEYAWAFEKWYDLFFHEEAEEDELEKIFGQILSLYEEVLGEEEDNGFANDRLGHIYALLGQYIKSKLYLERALQNYTEPYQWESAALVREKLTEIENYAFLEGAEVYLSYNRIEESLRELDKIQEEYFEVEKVNHLKAMNYYHLGEYEMAEKYMATAYEHGKENIQIINDYAIIQSSLKKEAEALALLETVEEERGNYELFYNRGILYYQKKLFNKALADFQRANALHPSPELASLILTIEDNLSI